MRLCLLADVARLVANEFGDDAHVPDITEPDVDRYIPSIEKANRELGLELRHDLVSSICHTVCDIQRAQ